MSDPRLNSVHLSSDRREHFRLRRGQLLRAVDGLQPTDRIRTQLLGADAPPKPPGQGAPAASGATEAERWRSCAFALVEGSHFYPLQTGVITLGRASENDIHFSEPYISRRHCAILIFPDGRCEIHDLASRNGTTVNGCRVADPTPLRSGDWIQLCSHQLCFLACSEAFPDADVTQEEWPPRG